MQLTNMLRGRSGFTLLEVLVAMVILAIGLLGLAALQVIAIKGHAFGHQMSYATSLAQQTFEELNNLGFDDAALDSSGNPHTQTVAGDRGVTYTATWNVQDDTPAADMKAVTLDITWDSLRLGKASQTAAQRQTRATFTTVISR